MYCYNKSRAIIIREKQILYFHSLLSTLTFKMRLNNDWFDVIHYNDWNLKYLVCIGFKLIEMNWVHRSFLNFEFDPKII